jgi:hypothetical protein
MIDPNEESVDTIVMSPALSKPKPKFAVLKKFNIFGKNSESEPQAASNVHLLNQQHLLLLQQQQMQNSGLVMPTTFGNYLDGEPDILVPTISGKNRDEWTNKIEYMLSVIGYVVDLGNCIRFPYICYKNGGGAFLIPYFIFLTVIGIPMMYLEMSIGQFFRVGNITLWSKVNIFMKGIHFIL